MKSLCAGAFESRGALCLSRRLAAVLLHLLLCGTLATPSSARDVTITVLRVTQLNTTLGTLDSVDFNTYGDFYAVVWWGVLQDYWESDISWDWWDIEPGWSHTFSTTDPTIEGSLRIGDEDPFRPDPYTAWDQRMHMVGDSEYFHFGLNLLNGVITPIYPDLAPISVVGPPNNRIYHFKGADDDPVALESWWQFYIQDLEPPEVQIWGAAPENTWTQSAELRVVNASDALSGVNRIEFWRNAVLQKTTYGVSDSITDTQEGINTWRLSVFDNDGYHADKTVITKIDRTLPPPFVFYADPNGWTNTPVTMRWRGISDAASGFHDVYFRIYGPDGDPFSYSTAPEGSFVVSDEGTYEMAALAYDWAGNKRIESAMVYIDKTPPVDPQTTVSPSAWTNGEVSVAFSATDTLSGIWKYETALDDGPFNTAVSPYAVTAEGLHMLHIKAYDKAGNTLSWGAFTRIDRTPPVPFGPTIDPPGWANGATVSVSFATIDAASAMDRYEVAVDGGPYSVRSSPYALPTAGLGNGVHVVHVKAFDNAGNSRLGDANIYIDKNAPWSPLVNINSGATWTSDPNVTLALYAHDNETGIIDGMRLSNDGASWTDWMPLAYTVPWTLQAPDGLKTVYAQFRDPAGNIASASDTITLATTRPTATISAPDIGHTGAEPVTFPVDFDCSVRNFYASGIRVNTTGVVYVKAVQVDGSGSHYNVTLSGISGLGSVGITVKQNAAMGPNHLGCAESAPGPTCQIAGNMLAGLAKQLPNTTDVELKSVVLYLKADGYGYVMEPDRSSGIRVEGAIAGEVGQRVRANGQVATNAYGEKCIAGSTTALGISSPVRPVQCNQTSLQQALMDGIYVTFVGKVMVSKSGAFAVKDGSPYGNMGVIVSRDIALPPVGASALVRGAAGMRSGKRVIYPTYIGRAD